MRKRLVDNHVMWEQNTIVEMLMQTEPGLFDEIQNFNDEVIEWWLVTPFLAQMLCEESETILQSHDCHWWGRQTSGQAIHMDSVIGRICKRLN